MTYISSDLNLLYLAVINRRFGVYLWLKYLDIFILAEITYSLMCLTLLQTWHKCVPRQCVQSTTSSWMNVHYSPFKSHIFAFSSMKNVFGIVDVAFFYHGRHISQYIKMDLCTSIQEIFCNAIYSFPLMATFVTQKTFLPTIVTKDLSSDSRKETERCICEYMCVWSPLGFTNPLGTV